MARIRNMQNCFIPTVWHLSIVEVYGASYDMIEKKYAHLKFILLKKYNCQLVLKLTTTQEYFVSWFSAWRLYKRNISISWYSTWQHRLALQEESHRHVQCSEGICGFWGRRSLEEEIFISNKINTNLSSSHLTFPSFMFPKLKICLANENNVIFNRKFLHHQKSDFMKSFIFWRSIHRRIKM